MRRYLAVFFVISLTAVLNAQFDEYPYENNGVIRGGLGLNWIDGDLYYSLAFRPEVSFLNFGAGLDLKLDFNTEGELRKENFNEFSDYLSLIRYVRYGYKNDPLFVKLGALDYYTLGHGSIMYRYNNSPSYDARKIGLVVDLDAGIAGLETIYSRFGEAGVIGMRAYTRPFRFTSLVSVPVINNIETGITYAADYHPYAGVSSGYYEPGRDLFVVEKDEGGINIIGADIGIPIPLSSVVAAEFYLDYVKILNFGSGAAAGVLFNFDGLGLVDVYARAERRFNGRNYLPSYFNSLYEIQRFSIDPSGTGFSSKASVLKNASPVNGYFAEAGILVLNTVHIIAGFQSRDKAPRKGVLHITAEAAPENFPIVIRAGFDKVNIETDTEIFLLDDNSFLFTELGYKPLPYLVVSLLYSWTYTPVRDTGNDIIGYEPIKRIEPRISFVYPFGF